MAFDRRKKKRSERRQARVMQRGIFLLPNLVTTMGLLCGFAAVIRAIHGHYDDAAKLILVAGVFDFLDGYVARLTKSSSDFGVQYDSLSDLVSFGLAPGILVYLWALAPFGRIGWLATFLFFACAALRLARFNVQAHDVEKTYFQGLPTPGAAGLIATWVLFHFALSERYQLDPETIPLTIVPAVFVLAFLMVSQFRYRNLKRVSLRDRSPFQYLVMSIPIIVIIFYKPEMTLFPIASLYVAHGPLEALIFYKRRRQEREHTREVRAPLGAEREHDTPPV